ncbi:MAG: hypothetical protein ABWX92_08915 [Mycetocola sp.]
MPATLLSALKPVDRAPTFADTVHSRLRRSGPAAFFGRPQRADLVFLAPLRPLATHHWHRGETRLTRVNLRLAMTLSTDAGLRRGIRGERGADAVSERPASGGPAAGPRRTGHPSAVRIAHRTAGPVAPVTVTVQAATSDREAFRPGPAGPRGERGPTAVLMVQRNSTSQAPERVAREAPGEAHTAATLTMKAAWGDAPHAIAAGPAVLTTQDIPGVVNDVVREIDRRLVAARERRGWVG